MRVKIIPHPHSAFRTRGIPPFIARSGDVNFGYSPGMTAFDVFARRSLGGGGGVGGYSDGNSIRHDPLFTPLDSLVTEIRVERGYSPGIPRVFPHVVAETGFKSPGYARGYPPGIPRVQNVPWGWGSILTVT